MTAATASKETTTPAKKPRRPDLRVVRVDLEKMERELVAEAAHMRPAITRESVDRERLKGELAQREARLAELIDKKTLVRTLAETFDAAINDEIADLEAAIALYSGVRPRLPMPSDG